MTRVRIKIRHVGHRKFSLGLLSALLGAFLLGVSLSALLLLPNILFPLPQHTTGELAAVSESTNEVPTPSKEESTSEPSETSIISVGEVSGAATETEEAVTEPAPSTVSPLLDDTTAETGFDAVAVIISDIEREMARLNLQIERIKNDSVALVTAFNQNCGIWSDPCAEPYIGPLEKNNAAYASLSKELERLTQDRELFLSANNNGEVP